MSKKTAPLKGVKGSSERDERLKAALKANLQRRKAQSRARNDGTKDNKAG